MKILKIALVITLFIPSLSKACDKEYETIKAATSPSTNFVGVIQLDEFEFGNQIVPLNEQSRKNLEQALEESMGVCIYGTRKSGTFFAYNVEVI